MGVEKCITGGIYSRCFGSELDWYSLASTKMDVAKTHKLLRCLTGESPKTLLIRFSSENVLVAKNDRRNALGNDTMYCQKDTSFSPQPIVSK